MITVILGVCANGAVALITLILVLILAWNYIKLLFEAAERYILLGILVFTAPVAFATLLVSCMVLFYTIPVFAAELTEAEVEQAVASQGKDRGGCPGRD